MKQAFQIPSDFGCELLESLDAIPWALDIPSGKFTYVGPQAESILGYPADEWYQEGFWESHLHPEDRDGAVRFCQEATRGRQDHDFEYRMIARDGQAVWLRDQVYVKTVDGVAVSLQGLMHDITDRKLAEQALNKLIETNAAEDLPRFFQTCVEQLAMAYQTAYAFIGLLPDDNLERVQTQAVWAHGQFIDNFDYTLAGTPCMDILNREKAIIADNVAEEYPDDTMLVEMQARSYFGSPLVDSKGRTLGLVSILDTKPMVLKPWMEPLLGRFAQRIAYELERSQIESSLQQTKKQLDMMLDARTRELASSEHRLSLLLSSAPLVVYTARAGGDYAATFISDNVESVIGYHADEFLNKPDFWFDHIHPDDRQAVSQGLDQLSDHGRHDFEYRFQMPDGSYQWFLDHARLIDTTGGGEAEIVGYWVNIHQRKSTEVAFAEARLRAEQASQAKTEFLSRISHELRTPLNAILGFSQLIEMDKSDLSGEQQMHLGEIIDAGKHLLHLVNEVLDLTKIEQGALRLDISPVNLNRTIKDCINMVRPMMQSHRVTLTDINETCCNQHLLADPLYLKQVLLNLLSNAAKYNRPGGNVVLRCTARDNGMIRISVEDSGIGIAAEDMADLFSVFNRLGAEYSNVDGAGVGLAISKRLVEEMGGAIGVDSELDTGSTFWLELPLAESAGQGTDEAPAQDNRQSDQEVACARLSVLYVEDNAQNQRIVEEMVTRCYDVDFHVAVSGQKALQLVESSCPDVILIDINLPDMDGYQLYEQLRSDPGRQQIPVIAISANAMPADVQKGKDAGFIDYITKPIDFERFFVLLDEYIPRSPA